MAYKRLSSAFDAILVPLAQGRYTSPPFQVFVFTLLLITTMVALPACSAAPLVEATQTPLSRTPGPTATSLPTLTPTAQTPRVILLAPPGVDEPLAGAMEAALVDLAPQDGLRFERLDSLTVNDLAPDLRIVIALPPDPGLAGLAAASPGTQFLALGIPGLSPSGNLSAIQPAGERPDRQGFLAGYLASVVTPDWRVGVIGQGDSPSGKAAINGFLNGVIFYCGLCRPAYPPFNAYPASFALTSGAGTAERQAAADALLGQGITTVYLAPGAADALLLEYLADAGVSLVGSSPPLASVQEHWIAAIQTDWVAALRAAWPGLVKGEQLDIQALPVVITDVNEALFSPGRQQWVEQTRLDLNTGLIDPGIDLASGEIQQ